MAMSINIAQTRKTGRLRRAGRFAAWSWYRPAAMLVLVVMVVVIGLATTPIAVDVPIVAVQSQIVFQVSA
ncbi:hypothetical protein GCM10009614_07900 [Glutamicibacter uratoxydans]